MRTSEKFITLAHGSGGAAMAELIENLFLPKLGNKVLNRRDDSAVVDIGGACVAFTTDSYVVDPLFFPGGDIGRLAVCGTVNDLACVGAAPLYISSSFILEEGLEIAVLETVVDSMRTAADEAAVTVVTGDTKVVPRGAADKMIINTAGIGVLGKDSGTPRLLSGAFARPGDQVILSGTVADHGMAVMLCREGLEFESQISSDVAPIAGLVQALLERTSGVHALRDPTRGGLAASLVEIAQQSGVCIEIQESAVPVSEPALAACELLGIDPLHVANEGKIVAIVAPEASGTVLDVMHSHPLGRYAAHIGTVVDAPAGRVHLITSYSTRRILTLPRAELLPRIC